MNIVRPFSVHGLPILSSAGSMARIRLVQYWRRISLNWPRTVSSSGASNRVASRNISETMPW